MTDRQDQISQAQGVVAYRQQAYVRVFSLEHNKFAEEVLRDLSEFCRARKSTFHEDPRMHAVLEGRREVWLRIEEHLNLSPTDLYKLKGIGE